MTSVITPAFRREKKQSLFPWHFCSTCYHFIPQDVGDADGWCNHYPDTSAETFPDRQGCALWECIGCGGSYNDGDDHLACIEGMTIEVNEC